MDLDSILTAAVSADLVSGTTSLVNPFIGSVQAAVNADGAAVYTLSGTTITGTSTQTSLVVAGSNNQISSPAAGVKIVVDGSNNNISATGAGAQFAVNGQNDKLSGTGGSDQFLMVGTGTETGNGVNNKFVFSTNPGSTSGITVTNFHSGSDKLDIAVALSSSHPSVRSFDLVPSAGISSSQFVVGTGATTSAQRFIYDQAAGNLYFRPSDSAIPTPIGHLTPGTPLAASDIIIATNV
jgi:hypothetical protein